MCYCYCRHFKPNISSLKLTNAMVDLAVWKLTEEKLFWHLSRLIANQEIFVSQWFTPWFFMVPWQDADTAQSVIYISVCVLTLRLFVGLLRFTGNSACPVFSMFLTNQTAVVACLCFLLFISASLPLFAEETDSHMAVITAAWMTDQGEYRVALLTLYSVKKQNNR